MLQNSIPNGTKNLILANRRSKEEVRKNSANLLPVSNCAKEVQREIAQIRFLMSEAHGGGDCRELWVMSIKKERPNLS